MPAIAVTRAGTGPEVVLVHGGASPRTTWTGLEPLAEHWSLLYVHRRGYPPSPPAQHDFDVDATDLAELLAELDRPHVVAHSYGGLGTLLAAAAEPERVRSLTLIEPPLPHYVRDHPDAARLEHLGDTVLARGLDADPAELREFLRISGAPVDDGPLPAAVINGVLRAHGGRSPSGARPRFDRIRAAGVPALVASGDHHAGIEATCDFLARELEAERVICAGAGHFVAAAPGFADTLDRFLRNASL